MGLWEPDEEKLADLILYVAERIRDDPTGGATKINKILYFAEFAHVRSTGVPISGVPYQKLPRGPAPRRLKPIRDQMITRGDAELVIDDYFGRELHRLVPLRKVDPTRFTDSERRAVDQAIERLRAMAAEDVSDLSHRDMAWQLAEEGEDIPFAAAYLANKTEVTDASRRRVEELAEKLGVTR